MTARLRGALLLSLVIPCTASSQNNTRGNNTGTNEHAVQSIRTEPKIAWETKTRYRDGGGMVLIGNVLVTGNINGSGGTFGYDTATGKLIWSVPGIMRGEPATDGTYAYAVNASAAGPNVLRKIDGKTGKILWSAQGSDLGVHDIPPIVADGKVFVGYYTGYNLQAYDAATGKLLWEHNKRFNLPTRGMAYANGLLYVPGNPGGATGSITALDGNTGKIVWSVNPKLESRGDPNGLAISNGTLVSISGNQIFAIDAATGADKWQRKVRRDLSIEPSVANGVVYAYNDDGIFGWDLSNGTPVFEYKLPTPNKNYSIRMAIAGGVLYITGGLPPEVKVDFTSPAGWLYAIDLATRTLLWKHQCYRDTQYEKGWTTNHFLPANGALYYENRSLLVKLTQ
jgi:outer membrane protein assembly factor BamB